MLDRVRILENHTQFDLIGYAQSKLNATFLNFSKIIDFSLNFEKLILDYLRINGYKETYLALRQNNKSEMDIEIDESILRKKKVLRISLRSQNWILSSYILNKYRHNFSIFDFFEVKILIKILQLLEFFRKGKFVDGVKFAKKYLSKYKKKRVKILESKNSHVKVEVNSSLS